MPYKSSEDRLTVAICTASIMFCGYYRVLKVVCEDV